LGKTGGIGNGEIGQYFSIQLNARIFKSMHEPAVGQVIHARRCIDSDDPQSPEVAFADPAITVSVHEGLVDRIRCRPE
jgi:hypothetical protein